MGKQDITLERVKALVQYDASTGIFTRKVALGRYAIGSATGSAGGYENQYIRVRLGRAWIYAHRLAWFYVHGVWPVFGIDHIDGDKRNNRIANLRDVDMFINMQNMRKALSTNLVGVMGVSRHKDRFTAQITIGGKNVYLGLYATAEEAGRVYLEAKRKHHPGCTI